MHFHMRFWAENPITLVDTMGGRDLEIFDASQDGLNKQPVPLTVGIGQLVPEEQVPPQSASSSQQNDIIQKHSRDDAAGRNSQKSAVLSSYIGKMRGP